MSMARKKKPACCPPKPKPELENRPLLSGLQAVALEATFKTLANATRLRMLHALVRAGELCVTELADSLGMKPQAVSNQLQRLSDRGIVEARRNGLQIYYRIVDPCVVSLLDRGWCLTEDAGQRTFEQVENERAAS
jgi:DNA-binding transcriptional ArsR family regulator